MDDLLPCERDLLMIKTVDQTTVADIFSINSDKIYRIPKYQREYTWGINDWNALFEDVTDNEHGYFLGSYICVNGGSPLKWDELNN